MKGRNKEIAVCNRNHHTAAGNHMPCGITQCYLSPVSIDFTLLSLSGSLNCIPALARVKVGKSPLPSGRRVCDPIWHVISRSSEMASQIAVSVRLLMHCLSVHILNAWCRILSW